MTVAKLLGDEGVPTLIIEKEKQLGGRLRSSRYAQDAELGAEFIHGGNSNVLQLLHNLQLSTVDYLMDGGDGRIFRNAQAVHRQDSQFARDVEQQYELLHSFKGTCDCSVEEHARQVGVRDAGPGYFARARVVRLEAASLCDLSAQGLYEAFRRAGNPDRNYRIVGGFSELTGRLSADAPCLVKAEIARIAWRTGRATVWLQDGSVLVARALVLTTPVDVLSRLTERCQPQLPDRTVKAIRALKMGPAAKVMVHVREGQGSWPNFSAYATDQAIQVWWNLKYDGGRALVGFSAGPQTWRVGNMTKRDIVAQAITDIQKIGGKLFTRDITRIEKLLWNHPGHMAYSYIPVGGYGAREDLSQSIDDTIWFAGEAAVVAGLAGTLSGAIESATTASRAIFNALKNRAPEHIRLLGPS